MKTFFIWVYVFVWLMVILIPCLVAIVLMGIALLFSHISEILGSIGEVILNRCIFKHFTI